MLPFSLGLRFRAVAAALLVAISLAGGFAAGWGAREPAFMELKLREFRQQAEASERAWKSITAAQAVTIRVGDASAARQIEIRNVTAEAVREVPVYVTPKSDTACIVPYGFVRLHDAAAAGEPAPAAIPDAAAASHDAASDVTLSSVASTVVDNYGTCRGDQERLTALQRWIRDQATAW